MKPNPENRKEAQFPKTPEELAWANDKARMSIGLTRDPRVALRVSESARRACCEKARLRNLRAFDEFAVVDIERDLGRLFIPSERGGGKGSWIVFYIAYESLDRAREGNPRVEEVVRVIKVVTLEELGVPAYGR